MTTNDRHLDTVRERFTVTADAFADSVRSNRAQEAKRLAERATAGLEHASEALAIDVACGPGTFTRPLAARVRHAVGVDVTPAMLEKACVEASRAGVSNIEFKCGDVSALPFPDGVADVVSCGYAVHHMLDPSRALAEMSRVLRPKGRLALTDIFVPEGADAAHRDAIERVRDPSHTNTQSLPQFRTLLQSAGLRTLSEESWEKWHDFEGWMRGAASPRCDSRYVRIHGTFEKSMAEPTADLSGFGLRRNGQSGGIDLLHTVLLIVAEKME